MPGNPLLPRANRWTHLCTARLSVPACAIFGTPKRHSVCVKASSLQAFQAMDFEIERLLGSLGYLTVSSYRPEGQVRIPNGKGMHIVYRLVNTIVDCALLVGSRDNRAPYATAATIIVHASKSEKYLDLQLPKSDEGNGLGLDLDTMQRLGGQSFEEGTGEGCSGALSCWAQQVPRCSIRLGWDCNFLFRSLCPSVMRSGRQAVPGSVPQGTSVRHTRHPESVSAVQIRQRSRRDGSERAPCIREPSASRCSGLLRQRVQAPGSVHGRHCGRWGAVARVQVRPCEARVKRKDMSSLNAVAFIPRLPPAPPLLSRGLSPATGTRRPSAALSSIAEFVPKSSRRLTCRNDGVYTAEQYARAAAEAFEQSVAVGEGEFWDRFSPERPLERRRLMVLRILRGALEGLAFMHARNWLHQSLGPTSIAISESESAAAFFPATAPLARTAVFPPARTAVFQATAPTARPLTAPTDGRLTAQSMSPSPASCECGCETLPSRST